MRIFLVFTVAVGNWCYADCHQSSVQSCTLQPQPEGPQLLIFVSFSMPDESLKLWSEQAAKAAGKLLIRGFLENSLEKTTAKTLELFGKKEQGEFLVDPESFQKFEIKAVPAVVVAATDVCLAEECSAPAFDVVYGDTSLEEALKLIHREGSSQGQILAANFLKRYRANGE